GLGEGRPDIGQSGERGRPFGGQGVAGLGRLGEGGADGGHGERRGQGEGGVTPKRRRREARQEIPEGLPPQEVAASQCHLARRVPAGPSPSIAPAAWPSCAPRALCASGGRWASRSAGVSSARRGDPPSRTVS